MFASSLHEIGPSKDGPRPMMSSLAEVLKKCASSAGEDINPPGIPETSPAETLIIIDRHHLSRAAMEAFFRAAHSHRAILAVDDVDRLPDLFDDPTDGRAVVLFCIAAQSMTDPSVQQGLAQIKERLPRAPVMVLGDLEGEEQLAAAMKAGANAYVPTSVSPQVVTRLVDVVQYGCIFIPSTSATLGASKPRNLGASAERGWTSRGLPGRRSLPAFTPRELQVLRCLRTGMQNKMIAYRLDLQESTVKVHIRNILKKLDVRTRTQAALYVRDIDLGEPTASSGAQGLREAGRGTFGTRPGPVSWDRE